MPLQRGEPAEGLVPPERPAWIRRRHEPARRLDGGREVAIEGDSERQIVAGIGGNRLMEDRDRVRRVGKERQGEKRAENDTRAKDPTLDADATQ
jgi:hypothetical protein